MVDLHVHFHEQNELNLFSSFQTPYNKACAEIKRLRVVVTSSKGTRLGTCLLYNKQYYCTLRGRIKDETVLYLP